jgi:hypothetical protein
MFEIDRQRNRPSALFLWGCPVQGLVHTALIVIALELFELSLQVTLVPEKQSIQILATDGPDKSLDERMGSNRRLHPVGRVRGDLSELPILSIRSLVVSLTF